MAVGKNIILGPIWIILALFFMSVNGLTIWNGILIILGIIETIYGVIELKK